MGSVFEGYRFILASQSPRRRELLLGLGVDIVVADTFEVDESYPVGTADVATYLSRKKMDACPIQLQTNEFLITSDTVVIVEDEVLGKPIDREDAVRMLSLLSGLKHSVVTGVSIKFRDAIYSFSEVSYVNFKVLTTQEIDYYVDNYKPYDKAGSYAIQEWIGYIGIESIEGSYYNIMGLPVQKLYKKIVDILKTN